MLPTGQRPGFRNWRENDKVVGKEKINKDTTKLRKRSVLIAGHQTSVSMEGAFWRELKSICKQRGTSLNKIVTEIDKNRTGNLSSALRVFILSHVTDRNSK